MLIVIRSFLLANYKKFFGRPMDYQIFELCPECYRIDQTKLETMQDWRQALCIDCFSQYHDAIEELFDKYAFYFHHTTDLFYLLFLVRVRA